MTQQDLFSPRRTIVHAPHRTGQPSVLHGFQEDFLYDWHDFGGPLDAPLTIAMGCCQSGVDEQCDHCLDFTFRAGWYK